MVLHRDGAQSGQRRGPCQHPLGEVGMEMDTFGLGPVQRPGLVPDRVGYAEPPDVVHPGGPSYGDAFVVGQVQAPGCRPGKVRHRRGVTDRERRLEVGEVPHRSQRLVELGLRQGPAQRGLGREHLVPAARLVESGHQLISMPAEQVNQRGVELCPGPLPGHCHGSLEAAAGVEGGDDISEDDQPRGEPDLVTSHSPEALPVPALEALLQALPNVVAEPEPIGQLVGCQPVVAQVDQGVLPRRQRQRRPEPGLGQGRVTGPDTAHGVGERMGRLALVVAEAVALGSDVVPEPLGLLVGVGVATDPAQQTGVVGHVPLRDLELEKLRHPQGHQRVPQDMLHRLAQPEVGAKRDGRHQFGETDPVRGARHLPIVGVPGRSTARPKIRRSPDDRTDRGVVASWTRSEGDDDGDLRRAGASANHQPGLWHGDGGPASRAGVRRTLR